MAGSYLLHNDLHYNGLMTDWGLSPTFLKKRGKFFQKRGSFFRKRWRFSERCPTYYGLVSVSVLATSFNVYGSLGVPVFDYCDESIFDS